MQQGKAHESSSLDSFLRDNLPAMRAFVHRRMGAPIRAKESTSDILQSAIRELLRKEPVDRGQIQGLFFAIAKSKICDRLRFWGYSKRDARKETQRLVALMGSGPEESVPQDLIAKEESALLARALEKLPADHREIVQRVRLSEESVEQVARSTGRSEKAVRSLLYRALSRLTRELERHEHD